MQKEELKAMPIMKSLNELEELSGMPYTTLRKLCMDGKIVHIRLGNKYMVNWNKFVEYLNVGDGPEENESVTENNEEDTKDVTKCVCCGKELEPVYGEAKLKYGTPEMDLNIELYNDCMNKIVESRWQEGKIEDVWKQFQKKIENIFK